MNLIFAETDIDNREENITANEQTTAESGEGVQKKKTAQRRGRKPSDAKKAQDDRQNDKDSAEKPTVENSSVKQSTENSAEKQTGEALAENKKVKASSENKKRRTLQKM